MPSKPPVFKKKSSGKQREKKRHQTYDKTRLSASARGYDRKWQKVRLLQLQREPLCRHCNQKGIITEATEVDHIIPLEIDREKRLDPDNLQSLCHSCHMKKTAKDKKKYL